ncbi:hypothetical protein AWB79_06245 [Caballeronia hypogeia]|uniref:Uncharacterized protein n=1 Tax=Caballeronia hypogeia TaxID=1777140 RepID=A0A158CZT4_9BURK|nr:hypothetical protein AWB79_06245 [Caballeronia hypogeia]
MWVVSVSSLMQAAEVLSRDTTKVSNLPAC